MTSLQLYKMPAFCWRHRLKPIMSLLSGGALCSFVLNPVAVGMTISFVQDITWTSPWNGYNLHGYNIGVWWIHDYVLVLVTFVTAELNRTNPSVCSLVCICFLQNNTCSFILRTFWIMLHWNLPIKLSMSWMLYKSIENQKKTRQRTWWF